MHCYHTTTLDLREGVALLAYEPACLGSQENLNVY